VDIETLVDEILAAFEDEPEIDFGSPSINESIRRQGIKAHIWDLIQDYTDGIIPEGDV